jgi:hypothetical protein
MNLLPKALRFVSTRYGWRYEFFGISFHYLPLVGTPPSLRPFALAAFFGAAFCGVAVFFAPAPFFAFAIKFSLD